MSASRGETASIRLRFLLIAASLAVVAGGAALYWYLAPGPGSTGAARPPPRPAVRVSAAVTTRQDVPVYVSGLGTVQASFTIGIHSQVEGIMQEVLFTK